MKISRYIRTSDHHVSEVVVQLPVSWWSRPYEYAWAAEFVEREHCVLDAACGISHPFKLFLARACEAHACDSDSRITNTPTILKNMADDLGSSFDVGPELEKISRVCTNIVALPYKDASFDRVFFLAVLQELSVENATGALLEFRRVLKPGGLVIATFDVPARTPASVVEIVQRSGLEFAGAVELEVPTDALRSGGLMCFRAVLSHGYSK